MNLAIVGGRLSQSKDKVPYHKPGWELWSMNAMYGSKYNVLQEQDSKKGFSFHRWFELHRRAWLLKHYGQRGFKEHVRALDLMGIPVYVWGEPWPEISRSIEYPKEHVEAMVSHGRYHAGSFDWMLACALTLSSAFEEIHFYGADMGLFDGEPLSGRPALEYWCGVAEGRGIPIIAHGGSLFKVLQVVQSERQYGAEDVDNILSVAPKKAKVVGVRL